MNADAWFQQGRERLVDARARRDAFVALGRSPRVAEAAESAGALHAFDRLREPLDERRGWAGLFAQVHPDPAMRARALELEQEYASFETELSLDRDVFDALAATAASVGDVQLERVRAHGLRDYRRSGVDRPADVRARIQRISDEIVKVGQAFDLAIVSDVRRVRFADGALAREGMPEDWIRSHPLDEAGGLTVSTDPNDFVPFLCYSRDGAARRELHRAYVNRGHPSNLDNLARLLELRHELATLLGAKCFADHVTEDKMVRSAQAAREFVDRIAALARPASERELEALLSTKRAAGGEGPIHDWERAHWIERHKAERLAFDSQALRPYFAYADVQRGLLEIASELYGVRFVRNDDAAQSEGWHAGIECYDVVDGDGARVARFWLDMHPRPDKYKHAAMFPLRSGVRGGALAEACLVCNFSAPGPGEPALMQHREVTTFFHEFGHLLHHLFAGRGERLCFSGIATEWDFVEVPSQLFEEWAWDPKVLARFARHHATGEALPGELARALRAAEEFGKGLSVRQQMFYARLALAYHEVDPRGMDSTARMVELKRAMLPFPHEEGTHFQCSFGHLNGYSAIYYTYMWSLVIAKDLFTRFAADPMSPATARDYRERVLAPGGSKDAAELVEDFLGRPYSPDAWQRWLERSGV